MTLTGGEGLKQAEWLAYCKGVNANIVHFRGSWTDKNVRVLSSDAVVFFASEQAGYITGVTLHVNGGMFMA